MKCEYGCDQKANYQLRNGKWCCCESYNSCPAIRRKNSEGVKISRKIETQNGIIRKIEKIKCQYCNKEICKNNIKKHIKACYLNPYNIKRCPICKEPIKDKLNTTCSQKCAQIFFRDMFDEIRANRNLGGYKLSYRTICFRYHKKECVICKEKLLIHVHHYNENKDDESPENLIPLCPTHHGYMHIKKLKLILKERIDEYIKEFKLNYSPVVKSGITGGC